MKIEVHQSDVMGNVYRLLEPIHYWGLIIPAGFESDGASVPRFFWRIVFPPGEPKALLAAFVHDYIYRTHPAAWSRALADHEFFQLLLHSGIGWFPAWLAWLGVRLFGWIEWRKGGTI